MSAPQAEDFVIVAAGERVGTVTTAHRPDQITVNFGVFNNGRGARLAERLRLNSDSLPVDCSIDGTSLMGGPVSERLRTRGRARS